MLSNALPALLRAPYYARFATSFGASILVATIEAGLINLSIDRPFFDWGQNITIAIFTICFIVSLLAAAMMGIGSDTFPRKSP